MGGKKAINALATTATQAIVAFGEIVHPVIELGSSSYENSYRTIYDPKLNVIGYVTDKRARETDTYRRQRHRHPPDGVEGQAAPRRQRGARNLTNDMAAHPHSSAGRCPFPRRLIHADHPRERRRGRRRPVDRDGSIICLCPIHEIGPGHTPSLALSITDTRRILVHCRSRGCDKKHFREIKAALARRGLPADKIGATRKPQEFPTWDYFTADGTYSWTKQKKVSASGRKRFICGRWDHQANDWIELKRPADAIKLFNLQTIAQALAAAPGHPLLVVEGEKDVITAAGLGALAVTNADGAGKWSAEDTRTLIALGARKVVICPDNDAPGIDHGVRVAKFFQSAGVETRWLELPELGAKGDLSDWAPIAG